MNKPSTPSVYYFAYGSNMSKGRMRERRIAFSKAEPAHINDYELVFNKISNTYKGKGVANIMNKLSSKVCGVLYTLTDADQLNKLDGFEAAPDHYERHSMRIELPDGGSVIATVYIANPLRTDDTLIPHKNYVKHLLAGKDLLPEEYYNNLVEYMRTIIMLKL